MNELRLRVPCDLPARSDGRFVLYWMTASRRPRDNYALDRAVHWAKELGRPLVILEALRTSYRWASDRLHRFVLDGMRSNRSSFEAAPILYYPYVEPSVGAGRGLLAALAQSAGVIVTDDFPCFFLPRMLDRAIDVADAAGVRLEVVDSNGLLPLRAADRAFTRAFDFRRFLQRELTAHLGSAPSAAPFDGLELPTLRSLPEAILREWPPADETALAGGRDFLATLPIGHDVEPTGLEGGAHAAQSALRSFLDEHLADYGEKANHPDENGTSRLSPYLHFGHLAPHAVLASIGQRSGWSPECIGDRRDGKREGWWNLKPGAEAFLEQLVTWRELGYNRCARREDYDRFESLPEWALATLAKHAGDERPHLYSRDEFERSETHDELWNAAQNQLRSEGTIHNYLRMLWGKKVLEWSATPREALETLIELNNKYALDGRNPNSYSGIFWIFGRFDRAWGPERPIYGKVRYMTSASTRRKLRLREYLERWADTRRSSERLLWD